MDGLVYDSMEYVCILRRREYGTSNDSIQQEEGHKRERDRIHQLN